MHCPRFSLLQGMVILLRFVFITTRKHTKYLFDHIKKLIEKEGNPKGKKYN